MMRLPQIRRFHGMTDGSCKTEAINRGELPFCGGLFYFQQKAFLKRVSPVMASVTSGFRGDMAAPRPLAPPAGRLPPPRLLVLHRHGPHIMVKRKIQETDMTMYSPQWKENLAPNVYNARDIEYFQGM